MSARLGSLLLGLTLATTAWCADDAPLAAMQPGTTIVGDQDAALGLYLMPWKDERPSRIGRAPGLHDEAPAALDAAQFARSSRYDGTARAYRVERTQRNR